MISNLASIWEYFDMAKRKAVELDFSLEDKMVLREEINDLYKQAGGGDICPGWIIMFGRQEYQKVGG